MCCLIKRSLVIHVRCCLVKRSLDIHVRCCLVKRSLVIHVMCALYSSLDIMILETDPLKFINSGNFQILTYREIRDPSKEAMSLVLGRWRWNR